MLAVAKSWSRPSPSAFAILILMSLWPEMHKLSLMVKSCPSSFAHRLCWNAGAETAARLIAKALMWPSASPAVTPSASLIAKLWFAMWSSMSLAMMSSAFDRGCLRKLISKSITAAGALRPERCRIAAYSSLQACHCREVSIHLSAGQQHVGTHAHVHKLSGAAKRLVQSTVHSQHMTSAVCGHLTNTAGYATLYKLTYLEDFAGNVTSFVLKRHSLKFVSRGNCNLCCSQFGLYLRKQISVR